MTLLLSVPPSYALSAMAEEGKDASNEALDGIDRDRVTEWLGDRVGGLETPLTFARISGGRSNLTFSVTDAAGARWALRRPPLGKTLGSAHDMGRESKVISALAETEVPVPRVIGHCDDDSVNGAPFYVMDWVEGPILRSQAEASIFDEQQRSEIGRRVVETLSTIHAVDPDAVGLGDLGKKTDYAARQLHRWQGQWEKSKTDELPVVDEVHRRLAERIPEQRDATIVHGDYRLDNMILTPTGEVAAVVDWELSTLGDPMADVGMLIVYWAEQGDDLIPLIDPATRAPGFQSREQVREIYAGASGRDLSEVDYFVALAYWKLAIILQGVFKRFSAGGYGDAAEGFEGFENVIGGLAEAASDAIDQLD